MGGFPNVTPLVPTNYIHGTNRQAANANTSSVVTFAPGAGATAYLLSFIFWVGSATTVVPLTCTIVGLQTLFGNTVSLDLTPTTSVGDRIVFNAAVPLPGAGPGTQIVLTVPASGTPTGPAIGCDAWGFVV